MEQVSLSDIELFYSNLLPENNTLIVEGEECHHIKDVMRHKTGDEIYISNGQGKIFKTEILSINKSRITTHIRETFTFQNKLGDIYFCVPRLKSTDRFEFALEKCVELGITNFIVFESARSIAKGEKIDRWEKILLSAMKQSLRSWQPKITYVNSLEKIFQLDGIKILFDQNAEEDFNSFLNSSPHSEQGEAGQFSIRNLYFIFGPEGGLTKEELAEQGAERSVKLSDNRLRSETAIVTAAALISQTH